MYPPIFEIVSSYSKVTDVFGLSPCRIYPFGEAPQDTVLPYATWRLIGGAPENLMNATPKTDQMTIEVAVYAKEGYAARDGAEEIRDAIENDCHVTSWLFEGRDEKTRHYVVAFIADWFVDRFAIST